MILIRRLLDTIVLSPLTELTIKSVKSAGAATPPKGFPFGNMMNSVIWQARSIVCEHLMETRENLEVANRVKSDFLSIISHELRTLSFRLLATPNCCSGEGRKRTIDMDTRKSAYRIFSNIARTAASD